MGIAQVPSPGSQGSEASARPSDGAQPCSPEQLEERLLAEELRELQQRRASSAPARERGAEAAAVAQERQYRPRRSRLLRECLP